MFRAGMRSDLVLLKTFQEYPKQVYKGDEFDSDDDDEIDISNFDQSRHVQRNSQPMASSCITFAPIPPESESEDEHLWPIPMPDMPGVLDPETGIMIDLLNEEKVKDKGQCFLDSETGFLTNPLGNDDAENIKLKKVFILNPSNQDIKNPPKKSKDISTNIVNNTHLSHEEKVDVDDKQCKIYQPLPYLGRMN